MVAKLGIGLAALEAGTMLFLANGEIRRPPFSELSQSLTGKEPTAVAAKPDIERQLRPNNRRPPDRKETGCFGT